VPEDSFTADITGFAASSFGEDVIGGGVEQEKLEDHKRPLHRINGLLEGSKPFLLNSSREIKKKARRKQGPRRVTVSSRAPVTLFWFPEVSQPRTSAAVVRRGGRAWQEG